MKSKKKKMTESEREVMDLLWNVGEPLTSSEMVKLCADRTWKPSYIHIMINSLLKKEIIRIVDFKKTTKNYARTFEPTMTRDQWSMFQVKQDNITSDFLKEMLETIISEEEDEEVLKELSDVIDKRKKELQAVS